LRLSDQPSRQDEERARLLDALNEGAAGPVSPVRRPTPPRPALPADETRRLLTKASETDTGLLLEVYDLLLKLVAAQDADNGMGTSDQYERLSSALVLLGRRMDNRLNAFEVTLNEMRASKSTADPVAPTATSTAQLELARSIEALRGEMAEMRAAIDRMSQILHG
jgi:hypothetical protein